jgi:hypothetical protein
MEGACLELPCLRSAKLQKHQNNDWEVYEEAWSAVVVRTVAKHDPTALLSEREFVR